MLFIVCCSVGSRCQEHGSWTFYNSRRKPKLSSVGIRRLSRGRFSPRSYMLRSPSVRHIAKPCAAVPDVGTRARNSSGEAVLNSNMSKWQGITSPAPMSFASCAASRPNRLPGTRLSGARPLMGSSATSIPNGSKPLRHSRIANRVAAVVNRPAAELEHVAQKLGPALLIALHGFVGRGDSGKSNAQRLRRRFRHRRRRESHGSIAKPLRNESRDSPPVSPVSGSGCRARIGRKVSASR